VAFETVIDYESKWTLLMITNKQTILDRIGVTEA